MRRNANEVEWKGENELPTDGGRSTVGRRGEEERGGEEGGVGAERNRKKERSDEKMVFGGFVFVLQGGGWMDKKATRMSPKRYQMDCTGPSKGTRTGRTERLFGSPPSDKCVSGPIALDSLTRWVCVCVYFLPLVQNFDPSQPWAAKEKHRKKKKKKNLITGWMER